MKKYYSFILASEKIIYSQIGFDSFKESRKCLENLAKSYCYNKGDKAIGEISIHNHDNSSILKKYKFVKKKNLLSVS